MESPRLVGSSSHSQRAINWLAGQWRLHQKKMRSDGRDGAASKVAVDKAIIEEMKSRLKKSEVLHQKLEQKVQELRLAFDGAFQLLKACGESMPKLKEVFDHAKDEMLQKLGEVTERVTGLSAKVCAAQADVDDIPEKMLKLTGKISEEMWKEINAYLKDACRKILVLLRQQIHDECTPKG